MLTEYIQAAMHEAHYELMENGRYFGAIPSCQGVWGEGPTLEACREELQSTLEDWIVIKLRFGDPIPAIGAVSLEPEPAYAEAD